jgi:hypothetical protein
MIQRIQTLYLFFALVFISLMFFFPLAEFLSAENELYIFCFDGIQNEKAMEGNYLQQTMPVLILLSVISLVLFINIFLFKNRVLQMRLCIFDILLMLGLCGLMVYYILNTTKRLDATAYYNYPLIFPLIAIILTYMAFRRIRHDELLVRSYDRIR